MKEEMKEVEQEAKKSSIINKVVIVLLIFVVLGLGGYYGFGYLKKEKEEPTLTEESLAKALILDPNKEYSHLSKIGPTKGVYWIRQCDLLWNNLEPTKGQYDWKMMDEMIESFNRLDIYPLVQVRPFANWDQEVCHPDSLYDADYGPKGGQLKVGKPCDMTAYAEFLKKAVERYDGDGQDDMPGLTIPIKYWEIINEPIMQGESTGGMGEELKFFVGTADEYLDILKTSFQTIKEVDSEAKVLHAGMAGMQKEVQEFWAPILDQDGGDYFDIANNHTISTDNRREDLYMVKFKKYLKKYGLEDKPIWITEVQYGSLTEKPTNLKEFEVLMVKSSVFALALGADKLFYIQNWLNWDNGWEKKEEEGKRPSFTAEFEEIDEKILNSSTHQVYLNLAEKINNFEELETIKQ